MKKYDVLIFLIVCSLLFSACQSAPSALMQRQDTAQEGYKASNTGGAAPMMDAAAPVAPPMPASAEAEVSAIAVQNASGQAVERIVIQNADVSIVVDDPAPAMEAITRMANEMGGFVVESRLYKTRTRDNVEIPEASISVRVPAEKLDNALSQIKGLTSNPTEDVLSENKTGQDVTKEYTDLRSQLTNKEEAEKQLRAIMENATRTEDVMMVFNQLTQIRQEIEVLKGQIQYYEQAARLSAISVRIQARAAIAPLTIGGWKPVGVARDAVQALIDVLKFLGNLSIWLVIFVLPLVLIGYLVFRLVRGFFRLFRRRPSPPPPPPTAAG